MAADGKTATRKARVLAHDVRMRFGSVGDKFWLVERNNGFERGGKWVRTRGPWEGRLGKSGLVWGLGLHPLPAGAKPWRTPAAATIWFSGLSPLNTCPTSNSATS